jgi:hypothetical protein
MRHRMGLLATCSTLALAVAAASCGDATPSSGVAAPGADLLASKSSTGNSQGQSQLVPCANRQPLQASVVIGPGGGQLSIGPNKLNVPAGALASRTSITGTVVVDDVIHISFEPEGLQFAIPAELTVGIAGCQIPQKASADIVYLRDGQIMEQIPSTLDRQGQKVTGPINHFSDYSLAFDLTGYSVAFDRHPR